MKYLIALATLLVFSSAFAQTPFRDTAGLTANGIEWCEENYQLYLIMENDFFEHHQHSIESRICGNLYNDPLWFYYEPDRYEKLVEQSRLYYSMEIDESYEEAQEGSLDTKPVIVEEKPQQIAQQQIEQEQSQQEPESQTELQETVEVPEVNQETENNGGGCLIATATFGSELAPQVQLLREIRDNSLLQTNSGSAFMIGFNAFYYSFSPAVADYERQNPAFREAVKLAITPLITSLSVLNYVDADSEAEVLGYGISLILLNLGMYLAAPAIIIAQIRKIKTRFSNNLQT